MALNRIGSVAVLNSTMSDVAQVQTKLATLQTQISSGLKAQTFGDLNGQVEFYTQLNAQQRLNTQYTSSNTVSVGRMQNADQAMSTMTDLVQQMNALISTGSTSTSGTTLNFQQQMQGFLDSMGDQLNSTYDGHYIFGGTNTSTPPVPDTTVQNATVGVPDDSYYAGSKDDVTFRANEHINYSFPVRADDPAFQKIYAAAQQSMIAFKSNDTAGMKAAMTLMQSGADGLTDARTKLNSTIVNVNAVNAQIATQTTYLKGLTDNVSQTDIVAASTQVSDYEAVLQATYQVYARLSQLRLSDYLK